MKAVQISRPGGNFEVVARPIPEPGQGQVRIQVEACGICHSDVLVKEGHWPGLQYPRVPGHEITGRIDALGADVTNWKPGQRVGVGWHGGHCFVCDPCRGGDFVNCRVEKITSIHFDGGLAWFPRFEDGKAPGASHRDSGTGSQPKSKAAARVPHSLLPTPQSPFHAAALID